MSYADFQLTLTAAKEDFKEQNKVAVAFTMGLAALEKGYRVELMLLSEAVLLAQEGYADDIVVGSPFKPVQEMFATFLEKGGVLKVCKSCMEQNGVTPESLRAGATIITAGDVVDSIMNAKRSLQLN